MLPARLCFLALAVSTCVAGQGTTPKQKASDYPVHVTRPAMAIAAEYLVHSFSGPDGMMFTPDYLVVEVAVYPAKGEKPNVTQDQFRLRINGKVDLLLPQAPGMVAASLKYPDWERRPTLTAGIGMGDSGVILGRPQRVERFPGDPRPQQERLPRSPRVDAPAGTVPAAQEKAGIDKVVRDSAFPEGAAAGPVSGFIYFAYKGKTKSIRSLELLYSERGEPATALRLF